jgi:RNA polymerase sigma-70 factor (ECF subfamily)
VSQNDTALVHRAKQGDQSAFVAIYEQYQPSIYTYIFYRVGDGMLADDLTADVFVRLVDKIRSFTPGERPLLAWLYTIAHNLVVDHYRHNGRTHCLPLDEMSENLAADEASQPAQTAEQHLTQDWLRESLRRLTEAQRQVILLKFVEGKSNAEVAALLGKDEGAIKSLQHRALAALSRALEEDHHYEHSR